MYFRIILLVDNPDNIHSDCTLLEGNYATYTLCSMNAHYPFAPPPNTFPTRFAPHANLANNTINMNSAKHIFQVLTYEQVLPEIYAGRLTRSFPLYSLNEMLHNTNPQLFQIGDYFTSGFVDLHPIRNICHLWHARHAQFYECHWRMGHSKDNSRQFWL